MKKDWLDKQLKRRLGEKSHDLDLDDMWERIEDARKKKKRRIVPIWWMGFGLSILLMSGYLMFNQENNYLNNNAPSKPIVPSSNNDLANKIKPVHSESIYEYGTLDDNEQMTSSSIIDKQTNQETKIDKVQEAKYSIHKDESNTPVRNDEVIFLKDQNNSLQIKTEKQASENFIIQSKSNPISNTQLNNRSITSLEKNRNTTSEDQNNLNLSNDHPKGLSTSINIPLKTSNIKDAIINRNELDINSNRRLTKHYAPLPNDLSHIYSIDKIDGPTLENVNSLGDLFINQFNHDSAFEIGLLFQYGIHSSKLSTDLNINNEYVNQRNLLENDMDVFMGKLFIRKYINEFIFIQSGLHYYHHYQSFNFTEKITTQEMRDDILIEIFRKADGTEEEIRGKGNVDITTETQKKTYQRFTALSIPLSIGYRQKMSDAFGLEFSLGLDYNFLGTSNGLVITTENPLDVNQNVPLSTVYKNTGIINALSEFHFTGNLGQNLHYKLGLYYMNGLNNRITLEGLDDRFSSFGLSGGLYIRL